MGLVFYWNNTIPICKGGQFFFIYVKTFAKDRLTEKTIIVFNSSILVPQISKHEFFITWKVIVLIVWKRPTQENWHYKSVEYQRHSEYNAKEYKLKLCCCCCWGVFLQSISIDCGILFKLFFVFFSLIIVHNDLANFFLTYVYIVIISSTTNVKDSISLGI